jgi:hypothetical protein
MKYTSAKESLTISAAFLKFDGEARNKARKLLLLVINPSTLSEQFLQQWIIGIRNIWNLRCKNFFKKGNETLPKLRDLSWDDIVPG